jgi:hypothetical protein
VVRLELSVYLMLAMLAGPWLCCCKLSRLNAGFVCLLRNEKAKPAENLLACCQHPVPVKDSQPTNPPDVPTCPCRGACQTAPALVLLGTDGVRQLDHDPNAPAVGVPDCDPFSGVVTPSFSLMRNASAPPSSLLTGRDLLASLHILRC